MFFQLIKCVIHLCCQLLGNMTDRRCKMLQLIGMDLLLVTHVLKIRINFPKHACSVIIEERLMMADWDKTKTNHSTNGFLDQDDH